MDNKHSIFKSPLYKSIIVIIVYLLVILIGIVALRIYYTEVKIENHFIKHFNTLEYSIKEIASGIKMPKLVICFLPEKNIDNSLIDNEDIDPYTLEGRELYEYFIKHICSNYYTNTDPYLIMAMVEAETNYNPNLTGSLGEQGLMQIMPWFFSDRMEKLHVEDLYDPYSNLLVGIDYINELINSYGETSHALMAYNGGPNYAKEMINKNIVSDYASGIIKRAEELRGDDLDA